MDQRVNRYLDGELARTELSADELVAVERMEEALQALGEDRRRLADADIAPAVMARIAALPDPVPAAVPSTEERSVAARLAGWLFAKRQFSVTIRPAYGLAALALLVAALQWTSPLLTGGPNAGVVATATDAPRVFVRFEVEAPDARSVQLAGSFSDWAPDIELRRGAGGRWTAMVPLEPGVHDYAFHVDGERWIVDPGAPRVADGFGGFNSRLSLMVADT